MRQIYQLSQVLTKVIAAVVGLKGKGQSQEVFQITNQSLNEHLKLDIDTLLNLETEQMIEMLEAKEGMNDENLERMAELFYSLAHSLNDEQGNEQKLQMLLQRSLHIYIHIEEKGDIYSIERNHKIQEIEQLLG
ncbi:MAG: hypothetical protein WD016_00280 [Balneolaceae bacterium]